MFTVSLEGDRELMARFDQMPAKVRSSLFRKVTILALKLEAKVKGEKLSGGVLNVRSGALRASIFEEVEQSDSSVIGKVASSSDVKYGAIHEYGGKTAAHEIVATKAQALSFMMGGKQVFFKSVHHPGSQMPERSFLRSSLAEMKPEIITGLTDAVREGLNEK